MRVFRQLPALVLGLAVALGLGTGAATVVLALDGREGTATDGPSPASVVEPAPVGVLRAWDRQRARAYARDDPRALRTLYVPGSRAGEADLAVLQGYRRRGLRVAGMRTQVFAARVLHDRGDRVSLLVTDALVDAYAVDRTGRRWVLPHDRPSTRRVVLVRVSGRWRVRESYTQD